VSEPVATGDAARVWEGVQFPKPGTWVIDPAHSMVEFEARHLMVAKVKGRFGEFDGVITVAEDPRDSSVDVVVHAASLDTRAQDRDEHLRTADFFEVDKYPEMRFVSTSVSHDGDEDWSIHGDLTIHGVTRPVTLKTAYNGQARDPWGGQRAFFSAGTTIDREEWGLTWNQALEAGGWLVGRDIRITLEVEAALQAE
jgi:polyisoprenoid-binding protein YceI